MAEKKVAASLNLLFNELKNFKVDSLSTAPATVAEGRVYFNTEDKTLYYGVGSNWNPIATGGSVGDSVSSALKNLSLALDGTTLNLKAGEDNVGSADLESLKGFVSVSLAGKNSSTVTAKTAGNNLKFTETNDIEFDSTEFAIGNVKPIIKSLSANKIADFSVEISDNTMTFYGGAGDSKETLHTLDITSLAKDGMLDGAALLTATGATGTVTVNSTEYTVSGLTKGNTYIVFVWKTGSGKEAMPLDVTTLIDVYTAGDGLHETTTNEFSIDLADANNGDQTEDYLRIVQGKLAIQGVNKAITDAVADAKTELNNSITSLTTKLDTAKTEIDTAQGDIKDNAKTIKTLTANVTGLQTAYNNLSSTVNQNKDNISSLSTSIDAANTNINNIQTDVSNLETAYKSADTELDGKIDSTKDELKGNTSSTKDDLSIVGVKLYADSVAKEAHGYKLQKTVASGNSTPLWAHHTNPNATADESDYEVDMSSIVVLWALEKIEVQIVHKASSPVTVSWSGIEPTSQSPLLIQYRVVAKNLNLWQRSE